MRLSFLSLFFCTFLARNKHIIETNQVIFQKKLRRAKMEDNYNKTEENNELSNKDNEKKKKLKMAALVNNAEMKRMRMESGEADAISGTFYNIIIGLVLVWGFAINFIMAKFFMQYILQLNIWVVLIIYIAGSLASCFIIYKSKKPAVSFAGFTLLAILMGLLLTFLLSMYNVSVIIPAIIITGIIVCAMLIISSIFPAFFAGLGKGLFISLIASIIIELIACFVFHLPLRIMDYVVIIIFCGYIGYDWVRAQSYPKTVDNAIDSAADIYVDIVNIFIRILEIIGKAKS